MRVIYSYLVYGLRSGHRFTQVCYLYTARPSAMGALSLAVYPQLVVLQRKNHSVTILLYYGPLWFNPMKLKQLKPRINRTLTTTTAVKKSTGTPRLRGAKWERLRNQVLSDEPLCRLCAAKGLAIKAVEVDHIIPLHLNGTNEIKNLQPLCWQCHFDKSQEERRQFYVM